MRTGGVSRASLHLTVLYTSPPYQVVSFPASSLVTLLSFSGGSTSFDLSVRQNNINIDAAAHANIKKVELGRAAQQGVGRAAGGTVSKCGILSTGYGTKSACRVGLSEDLTTDNKFRRLLIFRLPSPLSQILKPATMKGRRNQNI